MTGSRRTGPRAHAGLLHTAVVLLSSFLSLTAALSNAGDSATPENLQFFERKIRPLLIDNCFKCHSTTSQKLKGGLLLDSREGLLKGGDTGPAIVPGKPDESRLIKAVRYTDIDLQMPPKQKLAETDIADLVTWVELGAPWPAETARTSTQETKVFDLEKRRAAHWSWKSIQPGVIPAVENRSWPATEVDNFVLSKLNASGLNPAPEATKRVLIRRLYFDLIGLPPKPSEVSAFLDDTQPDAYERLVDRLLASPRFGERWGRHWLDLVRYAETLGHEFDYLNFNAWRYRDYVIRAFNADVPYDQFVMEHVAGDLLESPRKNPTAGFNESIIGTGFFWLGQKVHSPVDIRLEQAEIIDNQIDVLAKTFMGLTVACARCHDHKFDAISTRDYYSLFGVLGSSRYAQCSIDKPETIAASVQSLKKLKNELRPLIGEIWLEQGASIASYMVAATELVNQPGEDSERIPKIAQQHHLDAGKLQLWVKALADTNNSHLKLTASIDTATTDCPSQAPRSASDVFTDLDGWSLQDEAFGNQTSAAGDFILGDNHHPVLMILPQPAANSASISRKLEGVLRSPTFTITNRYVHILAAGEKCRLNLRVDNFTMIREPIYGGLKRSLDSSSFQWVTLDVDTWKGHRAYLEFNDMTTPDPTDEPDAKGNDFAYVVVSSVIFSDESAPPSSFANDALLSNDELSKARSLQARAELYQKATLAAVQAFATGPGNTSVARAQMAWLNWLIQHTLLDLTPTPAHSRFTRTFSEFRKLEATLPARTRVPGMIDGTGLDEYVFIRGNHKTPGSMVPRRFLEALGGSDQTRFQKGSGRLELAQSLTNPANPFLARVMVNRVWQHLFGRGLVSSPDDFGLLGEAPSHPEMLDWLAHWYRTDAGWSTKKLIRLLVTSSTYRMSSNPSDPIAEEKDPSNLLLHRMPVRRLECEPIRDTLLEVSGELDCTMFGPPVPVYLTEFMDGRGRPAKSGPLSGSGRRTIYQEVRRNFLPPMLRTFDFPVPFTTIGKRTVSNVPAQSLILMNDPFVLEQCRAWAKTILSASEPAESRIQKMYLALFSRPPQSNEIDEALAFLETQSNAYGLTNAQRAQHEDLWTDLCHVLVNLKEFIFLN